MVDANSYRSRTVSGTGSIEAASIEAAASFKAAAAGISVLWKDRTILARVEQYRHILNNVEQYVQ